MLKIRRHSSFFDVSLRTLRCSSTTDERGLPDGDVGGEDVIEVREGEDKGTEGGEDGVDDDEKWMLGE